MENLTNVEEELWHIEQGLFNTLRRVHDLKSQITLQNLHSLCKLKSNEVIVDSHSNYKVTYVRTYVDHSNADFSNAPPDPSGYSYTDPKLSSDDNNTQIEQEVEQDNKTDINADKGQDLPTSNINSNSTESIL